MACSPLFLLVLATGSLAFHTGAPDQACSTMLPGHGPSPQTGKSPYRIIMQKTEVGADEPIDILLTAATSGPPFKGFLIEVHPRNGDQPVGQFDPSSDEENAQAKNCNDKANSAMTHKDLNLKTQVKLKWTPPGEGEYVPVVTWVKQQDTFWVKEMADTIKVSAGGGPAGASRTPGNAAEEAKPKQDGGDNGTRNNESTPSDTSGQSHAVSLLNNIPIWTVVISILIGAITIRRLF